MFQPTPRQLRNVEVLEGWWNSPASTMMYCMRAGRVVGSQILRGRQERVLLVPVEI